MRTEKATGFIIESMLEVELQKIYDSESTFALTGFGMAELIFVRVTR